MNFPVLFAIKGREQEIYPALDALTAAEWEAPTVCGEWKVRDVVRHITFGQQAIFNPALEDIFTDTVHPVSQEEMARRGQVFHGGAANNTQAQDIAAFKGEFTRFWNVIEQMDDSYLMKMGETAFGPLPVAALISIVYSEFFIHSDDILSAVGRDNFDQAPLAGAINQILTMVIPQFFNKNAAGDLNTVVNYDLEGIAPMQIHQVIGDGATSIEPGLAANAALTITADSSIWFRLTTGRLARADAQRKGWLQESDTALADRAWSTFALFGSQVK